VNLNEVADDLTAAATASDLSEGVPPPAAEGLVDGTEWSRYFDGAGTPYYVHNVTKENKWEQPPEVAAALAGNAASAAAPPTAPPAAEPKSESDEDQEDHDAPAAAPAADGAKLEPEPEQLPAAQGTDGETQSKSKFTVQTGGGLWGKAGGGFGSTTPVARGGTGAGNSAGIDDGAFQNLAKANAATKEGELAPDVQDCLSTIAAEDGVSNWCGLSSEGKSPALIENGFGSINDVRTECFKPDAVCAALLRLQFQTPGATLTKNVYIWWSGEKVGQVRRGKLNTRQENIRELIRPHCAIHCSIEIADTEHASIGSVIEKVVSIISATEEEKANMTVANYTSLLEAEAAKRATDGGGGAGADGADESLFTSRYLLVTIKMVLRSSHVQDFGVGTEARQLAQRAWKKCSYEDAHVLLEARTPLGEEEGQDSEQLEHKAYVMLDSTRETARAVAVEYLEWVTQRKRMLLEPGWSAPDFGDDDGESLKGRRVCVMGKGQGVVKDFVKSRTGPSEHLIEFDSQGPPAQEGDGASEEEAAAAAAALSAGAAVEEGGAIEEGRPAAGTGSGTALVRVKLQRKGNAETPWIVAVG
jgi:hypothetical protein